MKIVTREWNLNPMHFENPMRLTFSRALGCAITWMRLVGGGEVVIDHAIIPIRELYAAAESRRAISEETGITEANVTPGGLWHTAVPGDQETVLTHQLCKLLFAVAKHEIPITLLHFPRFVSDPGYLYTKLRFLLMNGMSYEAFLRSFHSISRPELLHEFATTYDSRVG